MDALVDTYKAYQGLYLEHLISRVEPSGYISASCEYEHYGAHWFRDSSFIAISLLEVAGRKSDVDDAYRQEAMAAANRIIARNIEEMEKLTGTLAKTVSSPLNDDAFFLLSNHIYARFGRTGMYANDTKQLDVKRSWLMQHDSLPLLLLSLEKKADLLGLETHEREFLNRHGVLFADYLGRIYTTECANIWEIEQDLVHSYDVASVHSAFRAMERMCRLGEIGSISEHEVREKERGLQSGGPLEYMKRYFIRDGVLYSSKRKQEDHPAEEMGVDASAIYVFTDLKLHDSELGSDVEEKTIGRVEKDLFNGRRMPWRFLGDRYFGGRPWVHLAEKYAAYYADRGQVGKAIEIQNYVISKFGQKLPEQEDEYMQSPDKDLDGELARNGGKTISELAWAYAEAIRALQKIIDSDYVNNGADAHAPTSAALTN
ncbi:MAG: glycoside hydrolase family 15 protein [Candidatus Marsarchaeota archaeon]|nr:glycoside hydrolase family 15 protein [Candidatus Marsarchaeota archaeon]